jgi:hypothetical protein
MSTWTVTLGGGLGNIAQFVDVSKIVREKRLYSEMRPNVNTVKFSTLFTQSIWNALVVTAEMSVVILKDGSPYFAGVASPNYATEIRDGKKTIEITAEDFSLSKLGKTINSIFKVAEYAVCTPLATATSLVHAIATQAGVTLATGLPTITDVVPFVCILPDDKATWGQVLSDLLFEYGYTYSFLDDGMLYIFATYNTGTISTSDTFLVHPSSGNVRGTIKASKSAEKYDDIRVTYKSVKFKTGATIFEDTTGGDSTSRANIVLEAGGDADGRDYYPTGAGTSEIFSEWRNPDGLTVWYATTASMDVTLASGITMSRALTNYGRRASFAYRNTNAAQASIRKLRITGDAYIVTSQNTARSSNSGKKLMEIEAKYLFSDGLASALAKGIFQYYAYSDITFELASTDNYALGSYVTLSDSIYLGITQKCRIIGKVNTESKAAIDYTLEAVADYSATTIITEGMSTEIGSGASSLLGAYGLPDQTTEWLGSLTDFPQNPSEYQAFFHMGLGLTFVFTNDGITPTLFDTTTLFGDATYFQGGSWKRVQSGGQRQYLGKFTTLPYGASDQDWALLYAPESATCGLYVCIGAGWVKEMPPTSEHVAAAWTDILYVADQLSYPSDVEGTEVDKARLRVQAYTGTGLTFVEAIGANLAFINKLFASEITIATGGKIKSANFDSTHGFEINADGSATFNNALIRGTIEAGDIGAGGVYQLGVTAGNSVNDFMFPPIEYKDPTFPTLRFITYPSGMSTTNFIQWFNSYLSLSSGNIYITVGMRSNGSRSISTVAHRLLVTIDGTTAYIDTSDSTLWEITTGALNIYPGAVINVSVGLASSMSGMKSSSMYCLIKTAQDCLTQVGRQIFTDDTY